MQQRNWSGLSDGFVNPLEKSKESGAAGEDVEEDVRRSVHLLHNRKRIFLRVVQMLCSEKRSRGGGLGKRVEWDKEGKQKREGAFELITTPTYPIKPWFKHLV